MSEYVELANDEFFKKWDEANDWQLTAHFGGRRFALHVKKDDVITHYMSRELVLLPDEDYLVLYEGLVERLMKVQRLELTSIGGPKR
jgi:hypothetical protein